MDESYIGVVYTKYYKVVYYHFNNGEIESIVQKREMSYWEARRFLKMVRKLSPYNKGQYVIEKYYTVE